MVRGLAREVVGENAITRLRTSRAIWGSESVLFIGELGMERVLKCLCFKS